MLNFEHVRDLVFKDIVHHPLVGCTRIFKAK